MNEKYIAQLEAKLERLVEGAFTNLFKRGVNAHDIAMNLARAMENALRYAEDDDVRPIAPDSYTIHLHPSIVERLTQNAVALNQTLGRHIVGLAAQSGYRLLAEPAVQVFADAALEIGSVTIAAQHTIDTTHTTQAMQPIRPHTKALPSNPQLIINNGERTIALTEPILNIGRSDDNHIILEDAYCSRHHVQLRLRFGVYTLFNVSSRSGTLVNNVRVNEHQLQSGDVIKIGSTQLVYLADNDQSNTTGTTQSLTPVEF